MTYEERKMQLNYAMAEFIGEDGCIIFDHDEPVIPLVYFGETRDEKLLDVFVQKDDEVVIHTTADDEEDYTKFTEFSNDEMIAIMNACKAEIPAEL